MQHTRRLSFRSPAGLNIAGFSLRSQLVALATQEKQFEKKGWKLARLRYIFGQGNAARLIGLSLRRPMFLLKELFMANSSSTPSISIAQLTIGQREHELAAIVALIRSGAIPAAHLGSLVDEVGSAVRLVQLSEADRLFAFPDPSHKIIGAVTNEDVVKASGDVVAWGERKLDVRSVLDPSYPSELHEIFNRPALLFVRGNLSPTNSPRAIAVVGTRKPTTEGVHQAARIATQLVDAGFAIFSGLATGIDTSAHTAALEAGGSTSAVMGTGLDRLYPPENSDLASRILDSGGALISQFFPSQPPAQWTFPMRNVVMSGLSMATVVVEATETSGARMQARVALQHGRTVFLLQSLVSTHEWAKRYVTAGAYGTHAIEISSVDDIVNRISGSSDAREQLAVA